MADKRLLYVANVRLPTEKAHGLQIMKSCDAFAEAGRDVVLIVPGRSNPLRDDPFAYYGIEPRFAIRRVPIIDTWRLGHAGFQFIQIQFALLTRILARRLGVRRGDVVYGRDPLTLSLLSAFTPNVFLELHDYSDRLRRFLSKRKRRFAGFVTTNRWKRQRLLEDVGVEERRTFVAPNGVSPEDFDRPFDRAAVRSSLGIASDDACVMYVGRFYGWKGVGTFITAARSLPSNVKAVCVGGSKEEGTRFADADAVERVTFVANVPHGRVADYMRAADVLVLPNSATTQESVYTTSPIKAFEYMASGVPVVASDLPSIREIFDDGTAVFCTPDRPDTLADAIRKVLDLPDRGRAMAARAKERSRAFSWETRARSVLDWIGTLVA